MWKQRPVEIELALEGQPIKTFSGGKYMIRSGESVVNTALFCQRTGKLWLRAKVSMSDMWQVLHMECPERGGGLVAGRLGLAGKFIPSKELLEFEFEVWCQRVLDSKKASTAFDFAHLTEPDWWGVG